MYEENETIQGSTEMASSTPTQTDEQAAPPEPERANADGAAETELPQADTEADGGLPADSPAPAEAAACRGASDGGEAASELVRQELTALRLELDGLRAELTERRASLERLEAERAEFCELYPETPLSELPDEVWESVDRGIPLAAAYALAQRRKQLLAQKAALTNKENRRRAAGTLERDEEGFFSPAEVRAMTPAEVRKHYHSIMRSMQKWR